MYTYLVKLTPIEKFFFGQKNTFEEDNVNYFVRSSHFPQQTALLGLLRYQLLLNSGSDIFSDNKIVKATEAAKLIGKQSFSPFFEGESFGVIKGLSPIFLIDKNSEESYFPAGKRYQKKGKDKPYEVLSLFCESKHPFFKDYSSKAEHPNMWINSKGELLDEDTLFVEDSRVGMRKNYEGNTDDNSFFYETFYRFNNENGKRNLCFAFYCELETEREFSNRIVHLGGERQPFSMEVIKVNPAEGYTSKTEAIKYGKDENYYTVMLLSDAYIESETVDEAYFAVTEITEFACLLTTTERRKRFYNRNKERELRHTTDDNISVSKEIELYARGSLFYFKNKDAAEDFKREVESSHFHTIGYNHTIIIPNK
ncbi:MAG: type III-B CRISPR module-associated protein Cmr3 [Porphyromonas sp.]|nr:type III-B CRISPR module-associated protein Cmr3 [Porphyromonas sp.]